MDKCSKIYKEMFIEKYNYLYQNAQLFSFCNAKGKVIESIEEVLLEDKSLKEIDGYKYLENLKNDKQHLQKYYSSIKLNIIKEYLANEVNMKFLDNDFVKLCYKVYNRLNHEDLSKTTIKERQNVIDEFARVGRYSSDGYIWNSGVNITDENDKKHSNYALFEIVNNNTNKKLNNKIKPKILENNNFIKFFSNEYTYNKYFNDQVIGIKDEFFLENNNAYQFTNNEIKDIYYSNNNHKILCSDIGNNINRPKNSIGCNKDFVINKNDIYMDNNGNFLTLCPNCGCINLIIKESLSNDVIEYILQNHSEYDEINKYNYSKNIILNKKIKKR